MAQRQEQESAREEISEVAPNILRMQLPIRMPGLGHVNCYALLDDDGAAVVDPGLPGPATWRAIQQRLKQAQLRVKDVHTVLVTHSHPDHFGGAARFAKEAGAKVVAHQAFRFGPLANDEPEVSVEDLAAHKEGAESSSAQASSPRQPVAPVRPWQRRSTPWGGEHPRPPVKTRLKWMLMRSFGRSSIVPTISQPVKQGDVLRLARSEWFVVHTPGHTEDHICFHNREDGVFLAGDHVLPSITPHISGLSHSQDPLADFYESLDRAAALGEVDQVLPAHGHPFADLADRCRAIKEHHDDRLERVKEIGRELGASTVEAFSQKLFKPRSWGAMAESETFAHLEHLRLAGDAERGDDAEGRFVYATG